MVYLYALRYSMWNMYYGMCISKRCSFQFSLTFVTSQGISSHLNMSVGIWIYAEQSISNPLINYLFTFKVFAELCERSTYSRPEQKSKKKWNEMKQQRPMMMMKKKCGTRWYNVSSRVNLLMWGKFHCWNGCVGVGFG